MWPVPVRPPTERLVLLVRVRIRASCRRRPVDSARIISSL